MRIHVIGVAALLMLSGCSFLTPVPPAAVEPPADPNLATELVDEHEERPAAPRATMLEENEKLREMLSDSMSDRTHIAQQLNESAMRNSTLNGEIANLNGTIASLTERLDQETRRNDQLRVLIDEKEHERKVLAEMYASEKHQRLVFEKELLEREISSRTLGAKERP